MADKKNGRYNISENSILATFSYVIIKPEVYQLFSKTILPIA